MDGKRLDAIIGFKRGGGSEIQAFRYGTAEGWTRDQAENHCRRHDGLAFEAAEDSKMMHDISINIAEIEAQVRDADLEALEAYRAGRAEAPVLYKSIGYLQEAKAVPLGDVIEAAEGKAVQAADGPKLFVGPMLFVASEETPDRLGDVIETAGWQLAEFKKNPVFLFHHDHTMAPLGTVPKVWIEEKQMLNAVKWDEEDPLAQFIMGKYIRRVMRAESVGFRALEFQPAEKGDGRRFTKQELIEISAVAVPMHPHALQKMLDGRRFSIVVPDIIGSKTSEPREVVPTLPNALEGCIEANNKALKALAADVDDLRIRVTAIGAEAPTEKVTAPSDPFVVENKELWVYELWAAMRAVTTEEEKAND